MTQSSFSYDGKKFRKAIRDAFGICVVGEGTKPVRIRAFPRGTDWQGWYARGETRDDAYRQLVHKLCKIPSYSGPPAWEIIADCEKAAGMAVRHNWSSEEGGKS